MKQKSVALTGQAVLFDQAECFDLWDTSPKVFGMTGGVQQQKDAEEASSKQQTVPMWLFVADNKRVMCRTPVQVEIRKEGEGFIAACDRLHVFANGSSYDEVVECFSEQVVHFCNEYMSLDEDDVIGRAVEIRELYRAHFEIEQ